MRSTTERGYGNDHQKTRAKWAPFVAQGIVRCWRCKRLIAPGSPWDLGHDDHDRTIYRGPEHVRCNRGTSTRKAARVRRRSREW